MTSIRLPDDLVIRDHEGGRIVLVVLDGVGGLPSTETGLTELESARTPNLDRLAARSSLGMLLPVGHGVTPGSGPAHLALFGYDPLEYVIGRGALSALGVGFELRKGDLAVRLNLATLDREGLVVDRRAGRIADPEARRVVETLKNGIRLEGDVEFHLLHEKEHRAVLVLRGEGLDADIQDTDPQATGVPPLAPAALSSSSERAAALLGEFLGQARSLLENEAVASGLLARGFARFDEFPSMHQRFGLRGAGVARYPMYRGVARLVGMQIPGVPNSDEEAVSMFEEAFSDFDFLFLHYKAPDARGEDADFDGKVRAIEEADAWMARVAALEPDVLIVTGDHSTPATMGIHSWHPVPVLLQSRWARPTGGAFCEHTCRGGDLGSFEARHLISLALAHAGRLEKFGA